MSIEFTHVVGNIKSELWASPSTRKRGGCLAAFHRARRRRTLNQELEGIYSDSRQLALHRRQWINEASSIMAGRGIEPESFVAARAQCFAHEFRGAFERHPSRKLTLLDAFLSYVRKMLSY
jgi:hypothetical protein